jgi:NAD(P)-dependent dehydrogenase (short-subunit alcohol dehydrogenase family)
VNYVSREADARATVDAITTKGRRALAAAGDVSKSAHVTALVAAVETGLGPVDILVNNAGRVAFESIDQMSEASWNEIIQVNLSSVFLMTQAVLPGMRARKWGRIINLTSGGCTGGEHDGRALLRSKGGRHRGDQELRANAGERRRHRQRDLAGTHRDRDGGVESTREARHDSGRPLRAGGRVR